MKHLNSGLLEIIDENQLRELKVKYKDRLLKEPTKKPNMQNLFRSVGASYAKYRKCMLLYGGAENFHNYLSRADELELDALQQLFEITIKSLIDDLNNPESNTTVKEKTELVTVLGKILGKSEPEDPKVSVNIDQYLLDRGF